jgi:hypothetical protein
METKKKRLQITFDATVEVRQALKIMAARRNISVSLLINRVLAKEIAREVKNEIVAPVGDNSKAYQNVTD